MIFVGESIISYVGHRLRGVDNQTFGYGVLKSACTSDVWSNKCDFIFYIV